MAHVHIYLGRDGIYDPSVRNVPLAQRTERQQAAINAYSKKPAEQRVIVYLKTSTGKKWKETMKLGRGETPEQVAKGCAEMFQRNSPEMTIEVEKFEVK